MNIDEYKKEAELIRSTDIYNVYDLKKLQNLSLSLTELYPEQSTGGHRHNADEVYVFISGIGQILIDIQEGYPARKEGDIFPLHHGYHMCEAGDVFIIPRGVFHKVFNKSPDEELKFWSVFEKYAGRN